MMTPSDGWHLLQQCAAHYMDVGAGLFCFISNDFSGTVHITVNMPELATRLLIT